MSGRHNKYERRQIRRYRIRKRVQGDAARPRLSVFRSARHIYAQIIDDLRGTTLVAASSREAAELPANAGAPDPDHASRGPAAGDHAERGPGARAGSGKAGPGVRRGRLPVCAAVGQLLAERAKQKGISKVAFDRGGYRYHGRVKALADGARAGGLEF